MSDEALVIDVDGYGYRDFLGSFSLRVRLELVSGVQADDVSSAPEGLYSSHHAASRFIVRVTSAAAAQALPQALAVWLATRESTVALRISYANGGVAELQGGTPVEEVARRIGPALASLGLELQAADPGPETVVPPDDDRQAKEKLVELLNVERPMRALFATQDIDDERAEALAADIEHVEALAVQERTRRLLDADPELAARLAKFLKQAEHLQVFAEAFRRQEEAFRHRLEAIRRAGDTKSDMAGDENGVPTLPVTIYLSEEGAHGQVEAAVSQLLDAAGLRIDSRDEPVIGSWFRRMRAAANEAVRSPAAREAALVAAHAADTRLVLAQDAAVTATLLQNLGPVIASLQPTKDAVLRVGALLIVKVDWTVNVFQLTAAQQAKLDHQPQLAVSPHEIIAALDLTPAAQANDSPLRLE